MTLTWKYLQRRTLPKLANTNKKLNNTPLTEHKTDMNITKINKYKKMSNTSTAEQKTDININQINKYKKTEQHF